MSISTIKLLLIGIFILTVMVILGTIKLKSCPGIVKATKEQRIKGIGLIKSLWKKQIIISSVAIALYLITFMVNDKTEDMFLKTIILLSSAFVAGSGFYIVYCYNKFKGNFSKLMDEIYK
ncbi:hypothetical protein [Clostridium septicum]|uniref:DUF3784 domain-containing protein n=1 Tax=Clostridium septicum TaxID=1504 RepID=A0A9N7PMS8_CLOSE|nr:hypothetical protein [Clostridium septicum]AYE35567.1 hypothetical protein CP523_14635 [Clostridium septicum]MDU1314989.1 hypothetical protein [Clostridium septicum]QAS60953.1 hypothetical protein EI377_09600 [Clostridium septicum]UEC19770.1 hypothetical protein LK444_10110 [Clostridium septicum]USS02170.1 hypothetical protein NH397_07060 [Clostridium septicum]